MNDITININGGNNQILPNATEAVQNFYGDQYAEKILGTSTPDSASIPELGKLSLYIDKVNLSGYISQIGKCLNATQSIQIFIGDEFLNQMSKATDKLKVEVVSTPFFSMKFNFFLFTLKINWKFSLNRR